MSSHKLLLLFLLVSDLSAQPTVANWEAIQLAGGVIEPMVGMFDKDCAVGECKSGKCRFQNCKEPVSCAGGVCEFINCKDASCKGGLCRFIDCGQSTCNGGNCQFHRPRHTLSDGYCNGGVCYLNGGKHPHAFKNRLTY